jgi:hypothetical protein
VVGLSRLAIARVSFLQFLIPFCDLEIAPLATPAAKSVCQL